MRLVLIGPPGSGKGTQAERLTERLHLRYIGTGGILREAIRQGTPYGKIAEPILKAGKLVSDEMVNRLVMDLFDSPSPPVDFVLDGYPRTIAQARWFDEYLASRHIYIDAAIEFTIADEAVVSRIAGRRICSNAACGASFHTLARPPRVAGVCDVCGSPLTQRADDLEETVRSRLQVYHDTADAIVEHYDRMGLLRKIATNGSPDQIYARVLTALNLDPSKDH